MKAEDRRGREVSVLCENTRPRDHSYNQAGRTSHCCTGMPITRPRSKEIKTICIARVITQGLNDKPMWERRGEFSLARKITFPN